VPARTLVSLRRRVPAPLRDAHAAAWAQLHREATARGAHAWRFASAADPELYLEFLEFSADADPRGNTEVSGALARLDEVGAAEVEQWVEA
jgi:hypothetical protein